MAKMEQLQEVWPDSATNPYAITPPVIFGGHPPALGVSFRGRFMCQVPAVAAFAIALLPADSDIRDDGFQQGGIVILGVVLGGGVAGEQ